MADNRAGTALAYALVVILYFMLYIAVLAVLAQKCVRD